VSRPLLAVVDMQQVFADPASGWAAPGFAGILPAVRTLLARFDDAVLTRFVAPRQPHGAWTEYYRAWPWALQPPDAALWDLVPDLAGTGRPVVDAPTFGKWDLLRERAGGADRLVVCGVSTECCVLATVLAAADDGMAVDVVTDACAGASAGDHERAIAVMATFAPLVRLTTAVGAAT
jgi:nicotinamidase-related amidase